MATDEKPALPWAREKPHVVFDVFLAEGYRRAGYDVKEIREGAWEVSDPKAPR